MTLDDWLAFIERQHAQPIALGLERVRSVSRALGQRQACPVILVGGTNGKGSACALLERILLAAGYRVGLYTSPHLLRYHERVRIDGRPVGDEALCAGFERVERARVSHGDTPLTYFEFGTLCAWEVFAGEPLDAIILEVGLGGRLDATNIYDPDVAVVTAVDLDHMDYLGPTREDIGFEKAGIFRAGRPAICGDSAPPQRLLDHAAAIGADLQVLGRDFGFERQEGQWQFHGRRGRRSGLAFPALRGNRQLDNASCVLAALDELRARLPVAMQDIRRGLAEVELAGRFQVLPGRPAVILDVAHNPHAAATLAQNLDNMGFHPYTFAVFGAMADKDIDGIIAHLKDKVDHWCVTDLPLPRAAKAADIEQKLLAAGVKTTGEKGAEKSIACFATPAQAFADAMNRAGENDRIAVFGSFVTVAGVMEFRNSQRP